MSPWGKAEIRGKIQYIKAQPWEFRNIIKKINPNIVRGYGGYWCADWVSISKVKGIPTVVSVHDTNPELIYPSLKYADGIICMSEKVKEIVTQIVPNVSENIWVMPNRIDTVLFSKKKDEKYFEELNKKYGKCRHILHVGRKNRQKNIDTLIKALTYVPADVKCIFVGAGNSEPYQNIADKIGVEDRCFWVERVSNEELPLWYSWADCMCVPSRWEGFGVVFIEAAACESIIVTSDIAPMNEYLTDLVNAFLVYEYENPEKIAEAINRALVRTEEIDAIKHAARNVGLKFDKEIIDKREVEIYEYLMKITPNDKNNGRLIVKIRLEALKSLLRKERLFV